MQSAPEEGYMAVLACAHCGTAIMDRSIAVADGDKQYCCSNCAVLARGGAAPSESVETCAHCQNPIVDESHMVMQQEEVFCCGNCALAERSRASGLEDVV